MKRVVSAFFLTVLTVLLVACNSDDGDIQGSAASGEVINLRLAGQSPDDHPSTQALYGFVDKVKEQTDGRVNIKVYPANQLGDYTTVYEEITHGTIEMGLITLPGELDGKLTLSATPFLVEDYSKLDEVLGPESYVFNTVKDVNANLGVEFLGYFANGYGGLGTTKPVSNLLDAGKDKGILLRTPSSSVYKYPMEDLGFRTTSIPFADLYTALQTGAADGWSGGEVSLNYTGFRDVLKHFYFTKDFLNADGLLINQNALNKLTAEDQETLKKLSHDLFIESIEAAQENDENFLTELEDYGIEVTKVTEEEISTLANVARTTTWKRLEKEFGSDIVNELINLYNP